MYASFREANNCTIPKSDEERKRGLEREKEKHLKNGNVR